MQANRTVQRDALALASLFVAALVPWLLVVQWRHAASDLVVGICVASILAVGGTALSRMTNR